MIKLREGDILRSLGKHLVLKKHFPVAQNIKYLIHRWEMDMFSMSSSGYAWEYEVKVTRSDFKAELRKSKKWDHYEKKMDGTPNYFCYVVPSNLISVEDIPDYAGLYYFTDSDKIAEVKKPKLLHKSKPSVMKIYKKLLLNAVERQYLGCCYMTYKNRESAKLFQDLQNTDH